MKYNGGNSEISCRKSHVKWLHGWTVLCVDECIEEAGPKRQSWSKLQMVILFIP